MQIQVKQLGASVNLSTFHQSEMLAAEEDSKKKPN
jgi:hypothetical protein